MSFGPFKLAQPSHLAQHRPFGELTQDDRLIRARHSVLRTADIENQMIRVHAQAQPNRFAAEPVGFLSSGAQS